MTRLFEGKTIFVTGGGTGIGQATAFAFAAEGATVTIAGRSENTLRDTVSEIVAQGGKARYAICDVTNEAAVQAAVAVAIGESGRLDVAVNSAGIDGGNQTYPTAEYPNEIFEDMLAVNVRGMFYSMKHELVQMVRQGFGSIINISSGAGLIGQPGYVGYSTSKTAELGLTRSAALDYASKGIRINVVCPALVNTPLIAKMTEENPELRKVLVAAHPIGRIAEPSEIADAVLWLGSDKSSFVTGIALPVDGGYTAQ
ncbi:SDR family NAD(P)-dependent oxidoreductase [Paraburkholderia sp. B3]|uniref:SDR family NAD(P)-dependent oxidoreductase n=1 Tax=Paraburkholderia sp. B3 TaxID=3134791 RepID=UPI003981DC8F